MNPNIADCYLGNTKIKRAGVQSRYTQGEIDELLRCRDDIVYFFTNYVNIISLDEGLVKFKPYEFQKDMINIMEKNRFSIFCTHRQAGKTITVASFLIHQAIFNDNFQIAVLANKAAQAREILSRIELVYEELPWFLQPGVKTWNKGNLELANGSEIFCASTATSSIRGRSLNIVYMDEFAFVNNDLEFYTSTYPVVTSGTTTKVIISSTPNGMNLFYKLWTDAEKGKNEFVPYKAPWWVHPKRDEKWKEQQLRNMSERQFKQEMEVEFYGSSSTLISGDKLQKLVHSTPILEDGSFFVYQNPKKGRSYVLCADSSEGVGKDFSTIKVIDVTEKPFTSVLTYRNNLISPLVFASLIAKIGHRYNEALVIVENNSIGTMVSNSIWIDHEYDNLLMTQEKNKRSEIRTNSRANPGIKMTTKVKSIGCSNLKQLIESDMLIDTDFNTIQEFSVFTRNNNGTYSADKNKNDDLVMALILFAWFANESYFEEMVDIDVRNSTRRQLEEMEEFYNPIILTDEWDEEDELLENTRELFG